MQIIKYNSLEVLFPESYHLFFGKIENISETGQFDEPDIEQESIMANADYYLVRQTTQYSTTYKLHILFNFAEKEIAVWVRELGRVERLTESSLSFVDSVMLFDKPLRSNKLFIFLQFFTKDETDYVTQLVVCLDGTLAFFTSTAEHFHNVLVPYYKLEEKGSLPNDDSQIRVF